MLEVEPPHPAGADESLNSYVFEKSVRFPNRDGSFSLGRIDLYKRGHFVLEAKQGANDDDAKTGHGIRGSEGWDSIVTQWDGHTFKKHPVTGEDVPDEAAKRVVYTYVNPRQAEWPAADFIVGNPPFIGPARMRAALGDGYTETLRTLYPEVPESADFVMYWWHKAACSKQRSSFKRVLVASSAITRRLAFDVVWPATLHRHSRNLQAPVLPDP